MAVSFAATQIGLQSHLLYRSNIAKLSAQQLADFRQALTTSKTLNDDRGFQHWAGIHGLPLPMYCQHHTETFLPWHRAYLYLFELSLQDQVKGVTLPWWDWTSGVSHKSGVPAAYSAQQVDGAPNPLFSSPINEVAQQQVKRVMGQDAAVPTETSRQHGPPGELPTAAEIAAILEAPDFLDFSSRIEDVHDRVHVWMGGTMAEIPLAAYDPLFWAHHTMIDRTWHLWQLKHPNVGPPHELLGEALVPFAMTVSQTLSATLLGYEYAASTTTASARSS